MHIKTTMRYHFIAIRMAVTKNEKISIDKCGETGTLGIVGVNIKWCSHYGNWYNGSSQTRGFALLIGQASIWTNSAEGHQKPDEFFLPS